MLKKADRREEGEDREIRELPLPTKLYAYGHLLFEVYQGAKSRRQHGITCAQISGALYRSTSVLFEVHPGGKPRREFEIWWQKLGFPVDRAAVDATTNSQTHKSRTRPQEPTNACHIKGPQLRLSFPESER
jgi:hypothetical protein